MSAALRALFLVLGGAAALRTRPALAVEPFPITIENCGRALRISAPPARAISLNQGATELLLELGLEMRMVGTAYLDDVGVYEPLAAVYASVPVLAKRYPSREIVMASQPDFVYASYASGFDGAAAGSREDLAREGVESYLSSSACAAHTRPITLADVEREIHEVARIFDVERRGDELVARLQSRVAAARRGLAHHEPAPSVFWFDSGRNAPTTAGCCGVPALVLRTLGLRNVFDDLPRGWNEGSWERVVAADPDWIVLVDASWDTAAAKRAVLERPPFDRLSAVRAGRFVVLPFATTTPGFRIADAIEAVARAVGGSAR